MKPQKCQEKRVYVAPESTAQAGHYGVLGSAPDQCHDHVVVEDR